MPGDKKPVEESITPAKVRTMTLRQLLQDPVHTAIFLRGWDARGEHFRQMMADAQSQVNNNPPSPPSTPWQPPRPSSA